MKCDRRWWNDGRLEREQAACVWHTAGLTAWRAHDCALLDAHISASMNVLRLRLIAGDPTGQPWHEVLAEWAPGSASTFFGVRRP